MATEPSESAPTPVGPTWASWLGIVAVVLGVLLTAAHGNEWMKTRVIEHATPAGGQVPAAECPADELEEEGLSRAECEQMVSNVRGFLLSAPKWFPSVHAWLSAVGTLLALASLAVGVALVDYRSWAPGAAVLVFGALTLVDVAGFAAVVNAGPILRQIYLWHILVWFFLHLTMTVGAVAGRDGARHA